MTSSTESKQEENKNTSEIEKKLLSVSEVAKALGISSSVVRTWLCRKQIFPVELIIKLGRRTLFHRQKLMNWIDNGCI